MPSIVRSALLCLLLGTPLAAQSSTARVAPPLRGPPLSYDSLALGRQLSRWFFEGHADSLWAHSSPSLQLRMGEPGKWEEIIAQVTRHTGPEQRVLSETFVIRNGKREYWRTVTTANGGSEPLMLRWALEPAGTIGGFGLNPESDAPSPDPN